MTDDATSRAIDGFGEARASEADSTRPGFETFLARLARLSSEEGRELAEIRRVPDWRDPGVSPYDETLGNRAADAMKEARRIAGKDGVRAAQRRALQVLAERRLSWPGMRLHLPLTIVSVAAAIAAFAVIAVGIIDADRWPGQAGLGFVVVVGALSFVAGLATFLLPPSPNDLRQVVKLAAAAHVAGPTLAERDFSELTGGWYAVLAGQWSRGKRPYGAWGCLLAGVIGVLLTWAVVAATGIQR